MIKSPAGIRTISTLLSVIILVGWGKVVNAGVNLGELVGIKLRVDVGDGANVRDGVNVSCEDKVEVTTVDVC